LAEPGRPGEQDVVERLAAAGGGLDRDGQLLADAARADELVQRPRPQRAVQVVVAVECARRVDPGRLGHPWAALSALASSSSAVEPSAPPSSFWASAVAHLHAQ